MKLIFNFARIDPYIVRNSSRIRTFNITICANFKNIHFGYMSVRTFTALSVSDWKEYRLKKL